jgi:hypothetical protein
MRKLDLLTVAVLLLLSASVNGCRSGRSAGGKQISKIEARKWSEEKAGLQVWLQVPERSKADGPLELGLWFRNARKQKLRIYLVQGEPFRFGQSTLKVTDRQGKLLTLQPDPRPHGYVVTEKDFHLLEPGEERRFAQSLVTRSLPPGQHTVRWTYENKITRWAGGAKTLDGLTKKLFAGKEIPWIWTGRIAAQGFLELRR